MKYILIDDDPIINLVHKRIIQKVEDAATIEIFISGIKALEYFKTNDSDTKMVFLDINMPEMNGFEFLNELIKNKNINKEGLSIYILTSSLNNKDREKARRYPILKGYLGKPLNIEGVLKLKERYAESIG
jgi:response regulator of citrate/malate metabolism